MTFNIPRRTLDSKVRVHYIGWPSVRKGIPGSFDITVENTGSTPTGSFFLCIPYTEDIKLLSAYLPDNQGGRTIDASEMSDEESHNAVLLFPGLNPHEKYTFTVWAEGYVEGKYDARGVSKIDPVITVLGVMALHFIADVGYSMVEDNIKSGLAHLANTTLQDEEVTKEFARAYGVAEEDIRIKKEEYNMCAHGFKTVLKKTGESVNTALGADIVNKVMGVVEDMKSVADAARRKFMVKYGRAAYLNKLMEEFEGTTEIMDEETGANNIVSSWDPNEMVGPVGYGDENYIGGEAKTINYRILFENKAEATAPAYRIRITDELDENVFDVSSVRFGGTSHDEVGTGWKMKRDGNKLSWDIEGIELPPNVNAPEGEGYVTFSVDLKPGLSNLAQIKNMATIVFDYNDPIETNEYVNTLDLKKPVGTMTSAFCSGSNVKLNCKGSDEESGIARYKFFAAKGDGEFELIGESSTTELEYTLPEGENAKDYKFAVAAVDNVGNTQETLSAAIAATEGVYGDVTGDGNVNGQDIQALINAIVSESTDPKYDVNEDGKINGQDIQVLINIIVASN